MQGDRAAMKIDTSGSDRLLMENRIATNERMTRFAEISTGLRGLTVQKLLGILKDAQPVHTGIGGTSVLLNFCGHPVFVKKIPLTDLERSPEHRLSTANIFGLPEVCHYGIGSPGFSAWRELRSHIISTDWVLSRKCPNFAMLYHWRVLPTEQSAPLSIEPRKTLDEYVSFWHDSEAVRARVEAIDSAKASIFLFMEYVPTTLYDWLGQKLDAAKSGGAVESDSADAAIEFAERNLMDTAAFMSSQNFIHFDAHFGNILTDGSRVYFSDFGLALSTNFELTEVEKNFLKLNVNYDRVSVAGNLVHRAVSGFFGREQWQKTLLEYMDGSRGALNLKSENVLERYSQISILMDRFYGELKSSSNAKYPFEQFESLLEYAAS